MSNLDDFDQPPQDFDQEEQPRQRKQSFGKNIANAWQASPVFKIFLLLVGGGAIASAALGVFNSDKEETPESVVKSSGSTTAIPGGEAPPAFQEAVNEASAQRAQSAQQQGGSALPTPMGNTSQMTGLDPSQQNSNDPLAEFRAQQERRDVAQPVPLQDPNAAVQRTTVGSTPQAGQPVQSAEQPLDPNLTQAMQQQMQTIIAGLTPQPTKVIKISNEAAEPQQGSTGGGSQQQSQQQDFDFGKTLVQAGTINYGQMILEANSDVPGPIMAQVLSGPFSGARAIGGFQTVDEHLIINFTLINFKGKDYPVNILALDPDTTLGGLATETDQRYWGRVILPAAAEFISAFAEGLTQEEQNIIIQDGVVISERARGSVRRGIGQGAQEAGDRVSQIVNEEANRIRPLVKVAAGTPIGLFFVTTVKENTPPRQQQPFLPSYPGQQGGNFGGLNAGLPGGNPYGQNINAQTGGGYGFTGYDAGYNPYAQQNAYNSQGNSYQNGGFGANNPYGPLNSRSSSTNYGTGVTVVPANGTGTTVISPR